MRLLILATTKFAPTYNEKLISQINYFNSFDNMKADIFIDASLVEIEKMLSTSQYDLIYPTTVFDYSNDGSSIISFNSYLYKLLEYYNINYIGSPLFSHLLLNDKALTNLESGMGLPNQIVTRQAWIANRKSVEKKLLTFKLPAIVKPNTLAASLGIDESSIIWNTDDFGKIIDQRFQSFPHLTEILIESYLNDATEKFNVPIFAHCEDIDLRGDGCMNEDENARRLGLPGICNAVEDVIAARDILLARETGARLHLCHCSTEGVAKMMEIVKEEGLDNITAEVCPHHFILTSDDIKCDDPNYKMNPPLRTKKDVDALIRGLKDGSFKVISTDHAPHAVPEKTGSIRNAAFGIVGIETSFALSYTALVETGILTISQLIEKMSWNPAQILGSDRGTLQKGHPADIVIADIDHEYKIDKNEFASKGRNTPFDGWKVKGKILYTICDGKVVYQNA